MIANNLLKEPVFSFYLPKTNYTGESKGELLLGAINHEKYTGEITWLPVVRKGYWEVKVDSLSFGNHEIPVQAATAAIDTGKENAIYKEKTLTKI